MILTTTDGKEYISPDMCGYCDLDTGGAHQVNCPCYQPPLEREILQKPVFSIVIKREFGEHYVGGKVRELSYPDSIAVNKLLIDRHPEWGIQYL